MGTGSPVVLLESGAGSGAVAWRNVQAGIAAFTRVCAYDRAGYGFSDALSRAADASNAVDDLHKLLIAAKLREPLVLVGHSAGGVYAQMFAADYPNLVAGVVLLDTPTPNEERSIWKVMTEEQRANTTKNARASKARRTECLAKARAGLLRREGGCARTPIGDPTLDVELKRQYAEVNYQAALYSEMENFGSIDGTGEGSVSMEQAIAKPFQLGNKPLVVLSASYGRVPPGEAGKQLSAMLDAAEHLRLSASPQSKLVLVPNSSHMIQDDKPEVVVATVREVVERVRTKSRNTMAR
jgi:pimeloyl-ACP methyl ester carboxylesterase